MTQCFMLRNCKKIIVVQGAACKDKVLCILHMLRIHNVLRKWINTNLFDLHLKKSNPFGIHEPCIKILKNELIFEQYRMALNRDKYEVEVLNSDQIKRNQMFLDFMQQKFNRLYGFYFCDICLLMDTIMENQIRKRSPAEIERLNREINYRKKIKEGKYKPSKKKSVF